LGASGNRYSHGHEIGEIPGENPDIIRAIRSGGTGVEYPERVSISGIRISEIPGAKILGIAESRNVIS
jgi:hypothetical protein